MDTFSIKANLLSNRPADFFSLEEIKLIKQLHEKELELNKASRLWPINQAKIALESLKNPEEDIKDYFEHAESQIQNITFISHELSKIIELEQIEAIADIKFMLNIVERFLTKIKEAIKKSNLTIDQIRILKNQAEEASRDFELLASATIEFAKNSFEKDIDISLESVLERSRMDEALNKLKASLKKLVDFLKIDGSIIPTLNEMVRYSTHRLDLSKHLISSARSRQYKLAEQLKHIEINFVARNSNPKSFKDVAEQNRFKELEPQIKKLKEKLNSIAKDELKEIYEEESDEQEHSNLIIKKTNSMASSAKKLMVELIVVASFAISAIGCRENVEFPTQPDTVTKQEIAAINPKIAKMIVEEEGDLISLNWTHSKPLCARYVATLFKKMFKVDNFNAGVFGNSWDMYHNILNAGGKTVFSEGKIDYSSLRPGDLVFCYYPLSSFKSQAMAKGCDFTHVMLVIGSKNEKIIVAHFYHSKLLPKTQGERFDDLKEMEKTFTIKKILRPNLAGK